MSDVQSRILIVDDDEDIRQTLADRLEAEGYQVSTAADGAEALVQIHDSDPDLVLLDLQMPRLDGMGVLQRVKAEGLDTTIVVLTAYATIEGAVEAMRAGAYDFLTKPFSADRIRIVITKGLERERLRRENALLREQSGITAPKLIGASPAIERVRSLAFRAADSSAILLLLGPSGTGKEVLARNIHQWGSRQQQPFVPVNCVALPENLLESELFGHEKGAFTGASAHRRGRFELARGGTILLDEIGPTERTFQARLLRVLQEGTFVRVGGEKELCTDARIIASTNRNLEEEVSAGRFLEDLYYRLNVVAIEMPALKQRKEDIPPLADAFLGRFVGEAKREVNGITPEALEALQAYSWPGNVRELENYIERAVVLGLGDEILLEDLPPQVVSAVEPSATYQRGYHAEVEAQKKKIIHQALEKNGGNQARAAQDLGLQRTYLARLITNLGLRD